MLANFFLRDKLPRFFFLGGVAVGCEVFEIEFTFITCFVFPSALILHSTCQFLIKLFCGAGQFYWCQGVGLYC